MNIRTSHPSKVLAGLHQARVIRCPARKSPKQPSSHPAILHAGVRDKPLRSRRSAIANGHRSPLAFPTEQTGARPRQHSRPRGYVFRFHRCSFTCRRLARWAYAYFRSAIPLVEHAGRAPRSLWRRVPPTQPRGIRRARRRARSHTTNLILRSCHREPVICFSAPKAGSPPFARKFGASMSSYPGSGIALGRRALPIEESNLAGLLSRGTEKDNES